MLILGDTHRFLHRITRIVLVYFVDSDADTAK